MNTCIASNIEAIIDILNISREEFASRLNVSRYTVDSWIRGDTLPSVYNLYSICDTFRVSADYLFSLSSDPFISHKDASNTYNNDFEVDWAIKKRLSKLTPNGLNLAYEIIRHISVADDQLDLIDDLFFDAGKDA